MKKSYHSSEAPTSPAPSSLRHSLLSIRPVPARSAMTSSLPTISLGGGLPSALAPDSVDRFATTKSAEIAKFAPSCPVRTASSRSSGSLVSVSLEWLCQEMSLLRPVLEDVHDADGRVGALDAGLDQRELLGIAEPELIEPVGLRPADIPRGRPARRIGILVMPDQGLPVFVSGPLHGFADLRPGVGHVRSVPDEAPPAAGPSRITRPCTSGSTADQRSRIRSAPWSLRWSSPEPLASRTPRRSTSAE